MSFGVISSEDSLSYVLCSMRYALCPMRFAVLGKERQDIEAHRFRVSQHDIHVLDSLARGPFYQIVDGSHNDSPAIRFDSQ